KPHPRSNTMGWLANHLSNIPGWAVVTLKEDGLDFTPDMREVELGSTAEIVARFDENYAAARAALAEATDSDMMKNWTLSSQGKQIFSMPRVACLRGMIMNHMIHHRAQLTVYLRMNDLPVPGLYGPSADEGSF
ncbi:MAG TPA: DinB family protein, partial [Bryobacteraceae bacterium]|nr:DinB family protein [Bryobacteraceae bacterium]